MGIEPSFWGKLVLQLRTSRKMSQRELAMEAQVNRATLRSIEEGRTNGDIDMIERLLKVMGCELDVMECDNGSSMLRRAFLMDPVPVGHKERSEWSMRRLTSFNLQLTSSNHLATS